MRAVPDIAFNANPYTGQYMYFTASGAKTGYWYAVGGTSVGSPQWAGIFALANAQRALLGKAAIGQAQTALYKAIGALPVVYTADFLDVKAGADGSCTTCTARAGYDLVTGLGTPNANYLLASLAVY